MLIRIYDFAQFITISHGGVIEIYYNITWGGGLANLLQYYNGGGVSRDPKFVLRNIWTAPNGFLCLFYDKYGDKSGDSQIAPRFAYFPFAFFVEVHLKGHRNKQIKIELHCHAYSGKYVILKLMLLR